MRGYKYIEFSKRTAIRNPNMIIREYEMLIQKYEKYAKDFITQMAEIDVEILGLDEHTILNYIEKNISIKHAIPFNKIKIKVNPIKIQRILHVFHSQQEKAAEAYKELQKIKEEYNKFIKKFK